MTERFLEKPEAAIRRVEPTVSLLEKGFVYVPAAHTDIWKTFARLWDETSGDLDAKNPYQPKRQGVRK